VFRRLIRPWIDPEVFDFWASRVRPTWSWDRPLARIAARHVESADAVTLVLAPNRHWTGFRAGQHVNIGAEIDGTRITRSYSPSDASRADGRIAITVKAIEGGRLSRYLCHTAKVGDVLDIGPAFGEMTLPGTRQGDGLPLFLAAGSGITPLMAMTRELAARGMPVPLTLLYWARTRAELCFVDELRALARQHVDFNVHFILTRDAINAGNDRDDERSGRIDTALLDALVPGLESRQVYACGPHGFVDSARRLLDGRAAGRAASFQAESFTPPPADFEDVGHVQVTLARRGRTLTLPRGQSLLTALESEGLKLASGCRMGLCNTCACGKTSGSTRHLHTGEIASEPALALRLCVNRPASDLVLDL
jgi:ferredoxin-NADP reductase